MHRKCWEYSNHSRWELLLLLNRYSWSGYKWAGPCRAVEWGMRERRRKGKVKVGKGKSRMNGFSKVTTPWNECHKMKTAREARLGTHVLKFMWNGHWFIFRLYQVAFSPQNVESPNVHYFFNNFKSQEKQILRSEKSFRDGNPLWV